MFTEAFGIPVKYEAWNHRDDLPVYIAGSYDFRTAYIADRRCIILTPTEELVTLPALRKQITKSRMKLNVTGSKNKLSIINVNKMSVSRPKNVTIEITSKNCYDIINNNKSFRKRHQNADFKQIYNGNSYVCLYRYVQRSKDDE